MRFIGLALIALGVFALAFSANAAYYASVSYYNTGFSPTNNTTYHPYFWNNYQAPPVPTAYYYPSYNTTHVKFHPFHQLTRAVRHVNRYFRAWNDD